MNHLERAKDALKNGGVECAKTHALIAIAEALIYLATPQRYIVNNNLHEELYG